MSKWICINTADERFAQAVLTALNSAGITAEFVDKPANGHADICIYCEPETATRTLSMGSLTLDLDNVSAVAGDGRPIHFTPIEFAVLTLLMKNRHRAVSRDELLPAVWGFENDSGTRVADDTVKRLRRKLENSGVRIETVWGYGFKVVEC